jgi:hypothetical protein
VRLAPEEWGESLKACLAEKRITELGRLSRQEAFSRSKSPLYFIELLKFLRHSGQYSEVEGSLGDIFKAMDTVNKSRIDAHAKDIDENAYNALLDALHILETVFVPPP